MKTFLFFDTETTGFCTSGPLETQPHIVQIGCISATFDGRDFFKTAVVDRLFEPGGPISPGAMKVHGITPEKVAGRPPFRTFATEFVKLTKEADFIVGHNVKYDFDVLFHEIDRIWPDSEKKDAWKRETRAKAMDTMHLGTKVCKIPKRGFGSDYKWPSLSELHAFLFSEPFEGAHNALGDITATMRCLEAMVDR